MSESDGGELGDKEQVPERESCDCDAPTEFGEVVLVALADLLDDAVETKTF